MPNLLERFRGIFRKRDATLAKVEPDGITPKECREWAWRKCNFGSAGGVGYGILVLCVPAALRILIAIILGSGIVAASTQDLLLGLFALIAGAYGWFKYWERKALGEIRRERREREQANAPVIAKLDALTATIDQIHALSKPGNAEADPDLRFEFESLILAHPHAFPTELIGFLTVTIFNRGGETALRNSALRLTINGRTIDADAFDHEEIREWFAKQRNTTFLDDLPADTLYKKSTPRTVCLAFQIPEQLFTITLDGPLRPELPGTSWEISVTDGIGRNWVEAYAFTGDETDAEFDQVRVTDTRAVMHFPVQYTLKPKQPVGTTYIEAPRVKGGGKASATEEPTPTSILLIEATPCLMPVNQEHWVFQAFYVDREPIMVMNYGSFHPISWPYAGRHAIAVKLTNFFPDTLVNVEIWFKFAFGDAIKESRIDLPTGLETGQENAFTFYIWNLSPAYLWIVGLPSVAKAVLAANSKHFEPNITVSKRTNTSSLFLPPVGFDLGPQVPIPTEAEVRRRKDILAKVRNLYILSHDDHSPAMLAGLEPLPSEWVEAQLEKMGETWRQQIYM